jgi:uncharacterized YigZ family protein
MLQKGSEEIFVPVSYSEFKLKEKGSVFLAQIFPAADETQAANILQTTKKKYFDATHNCYSFRIYPDIFKYSDDGEPNGTAGIRILNALRHFNLYNCILIVTRYFGGTKLGVGPLGNAYYNSAIGVIKSAKIEQKHLHNLIEIEFGFSLSKMIYHLIEEFNVRIDKTNYFANIVIQGKILTSEYKPFSEKLASLTSANAKLTLLKENSLN